MPRPHGDRGCGGSAALRCGAERARNPRRRLRLVSTCGGAPHQPPNGLNCCCGCGIARAGVDPAAPELRIARTTSASVTQIARPLLSREDEAGDLSSGLSCKRMPAIDCSSPPDCRTGQYYDKNVNLKMARWFLPNPLPPSLTTASAAHELTPGRGLCAPPIGPDWRAVCAGAQAISVRSAGRAHERCSRVSERS